MKQVVGKAYQTPELAGIFSSYRISVPQVYADLDRTKAMQLGVDVQDVFNTMQIYLGSMYVNDFNKFGRTYQVVAQADMEFRSKPDDILKLQTKNFEGRMVPLGSVMQVKETTGTDTAMRYNAFRAADLNGAPAPGYSSGQAQAAITKILNETLPRGMSFEWTELTYQQILSGDTALYVFPICVLLVFLALAAQYESLFLPASILLILPMSLFSAIAGVWLHGRRQQHLHADQPVRADRARVEERHPDRRVRARSGASGQDHGRGRGRSRAAEIAADPDDVVRLHHGRRAAGALDGRGLGDAQRHGHRGVLRHARRDVLRSVPNPGVLRADARSRKENHRKREG